jgi:predicted nucleic-acid-binding protein
VIGIDTNVLLRNFLDDDPSQGRVARRFMASLSASDPGWISLTTIVEFVWVLRTKNRASRDLIASAIELLLIQDALVIEQDTVVASAVAQFRSTHADFADCLIAASARAAGCSKTVTFDQIAARDTGMELLS